MPDTTLKGWEVLEAYLFDHKDVGSTFTVHDYAESKELETAEASAHIQAYLDEQRQEDSRALYTLSRVPGTRTRSAVWEVGTKVRNARQIGATFYDDVKAKVERALVPDLTHLAVRNQRAAKVTQAQIGAVVEHAMKLLEIAVMGRETPADD